MVTLSIANPPINHGLDVRSFDRVKLLGHLPKDGVEQRPSPDAARGSLEPLIRHRADTPSEQVRDGGACASRGRHGALEAYAQAALRGVKLVRETAVPCRPARRMTSTT